MRNHPDPNKQPLKKFVDLLPDWIVMGLALLVLIILATVNFLVEREIN
jgi:hypothetical protein